MLERNRLTHTPTRQADYPRVNKLADLEARARGHFLMAANAIELSLGKVITAHFSPNDSERQEFLYSLVMSATSFRQKAAMFKDLLRLKYPELFCKSPRQLKQIDHVIELRNKLAHAFFGPSDEYVSEVGENRIELVSYRNGKMKVESITIGRMNKELADATELLSELRSIESEVAKRAYAKSD